jgi:hypothetical protein
MADVGAWVVTVWVVRYDSAHLVPRDPVPCSWMGFSQSHGLRPSNHRMTAERWGRVGLVDGQREQMVAFDSGIAGARVACCIGLGGAACCIGLGGAGQLLGQLPLLEADDLVAFAFDCFGGA